MRLLTLQWGLPSLLALIVAVGFARVPEHKELGDLTRPASARETRAASAVHLRDVTLDLGITATHEQSTEKLSSMRESLGGGICAFDVNRDGWIDLFLVGGSGQTRHYGKKSWWDDRGGNRLLLNRNGEGFDDITARAGLQESLWGMGCAAGDLDNDGFVDLAVFGVGVGRAYRNNGDSTFQDVTANSAIQGDRWSTGVSLLDYNGDGLLDIYVSNYVLYREGARTFERASGFRPTVEPGFDPTLYDPEANRLYVNLGGFRFKDVAEELGVANAFGRSLGSRTFDINGDRWPDLLVINDQGTPSQMFINQEGRGFLRRPGGYSSLEIPGVHDVAIADFNGDGESEVFMSRGAAQPPVLLVPSREWETTRDQAWARDLAQARLLTFGGWGSVAADFNNDGATDLFVARGSTLPDLDATLLPQAQPSTLFVNNGHGSFALSERDDSTRPLSARGAISADLDNDGRLELVVANNNDALQVFKSEFGSGNWLSVDLREPRKNSQEYGAVVTVRAGSLVMTRQANVPEGFLSQGDSRLHFGLGSNAVVDSVQVTWRDGSSAEYRGIAVNQFVTLVRGSARWTATNSAARQQTPLSESLKRIDAAALPGVVRLLLAEATTNIAGLRALWELGDARARVTLLAGLPPEPKPEQLAFLQRGLVDVDAQVRSKAIERLRALELELSIPWLLPLLNDPNVDVQCQTAELFGHFFDEEEAAPRHKVLAVAPLIRLLQDPNPAARVCALSALAASESKRAVLPALGLLASDPSATVRAEAARALGLVRDKRAVQPLLALIDADIETPDVVAAGLIALSRLDVSAFENRLSPRLHRSREAANDPPVVAHRMRVLSAFLSKPDGVVYSRVTLANAIERLLPGNVATTQKDLALAAVEAALAIKTDATTRVIRGALAHPDDEVRAQALLALTTIESAGSSLEQQLASQPSAVVDSALRRVGPAATQSPRRYARLYALPRARATTLRLLRDAPSPVVVEAVAAILETTGPEGDLLPLFDECVSSRLAMPWPNMEWISRLPKGVCSAYAECLLRSAAAPAGDDVTARTDTSVPALLQSMHQVSDLVPELRSAILIFAAQRDASVARVLLAPSLGTIPSNQLPFALSAVRSAEVVETAAPFLWSVLEQEHQTDELRVQVAELLSPIDQPRALAQLFKSTTVVGRQ